ncbi:Imm50 family immunity protein [Streptomyces sp. NPDC091219]|uniref:Imm50 family immunity protein n=1 Tax=Streptomyces sp. NPDC091219 TaxID=3155193 RepID=UPI0034507C77
MDDSDWQRTLRSEAFLGDLYEGTPPAIGQCRLFYVHMDERGLSVTLGFDTAALPPNPSPEWHEKTYNRLEFYLEFSGVTGFRVHGWDVSDARAVSLTTGDRIEVALGEADSGIRFLASSVRLANTRVYLASTEP